MVGAGRTDECDRRRATRYCRRLARVYRSDNDHPALGGLFAGGMALPIAFVAGLLILVPSTEAFWLLLLGGGILVVIWKT